jgi:hypothetical protein
MADEKITFSGQDVRIQRSGPMSLTYYGSSMDDEPLFTISDQGVVTFSKRVEPGDDHSARCWAAFLSLVPEGWRVDTAP